MLFSVELDDRIYRDIESYCKANNIGIQEYVCEIILERHSMNKYGDLNDIMPAMIGKSTVKTKKSTQGTRKTTEVKEGKPKENLPCEQAENMKIADKNGVLEQKDEEEAVVRPTVTRKRKLNTI